MLSKMGHLKQAHCFQKTLGYWYEVVVKKFRQRTRQQRNYQAEPGPRNIYDGALSGDR